MNEDLFSILQQKSQTFSKGQRLLAKYISESYDKAAFMTAGKLGKTVGVSESTVALYNYDKSTLEIYQLTVDGKNITVLLSDYPVDGGRYYLKVANIVDALGRVLNTSYDEYITFESDLKTKLQIISPVSRETLKSRTVTIKIKSLSDIEEDAICKIEIASDNIEKITVDTRTFDCKYEKIRKTEFGSATIEKFDLRFYIYNFN